MFFFIDSFILQYLTPVTALYAHRSWAVLGDTQQFTSSAVAVVPLRGKLEGEDYISETGTRTEDKRLNEHRKQTTLAA